MKKKFAKMTKEEKRNYLGRWIMAGIAAYSTPEAREKQRKARSETYQNSTDEEKKKFSEAISKGMKNMPEDVKKRRIAAISRGWQKWFTGMAKEEQMKYLEPWIKASQKANPSSIEKLIWKELDKMRIEYKTQVSFNHGKFVVDIYIPAQEVIIECDGTYWHSLLKRIERDKKLAEYANNDGYKLMRLPESEIRKNPKQALEDGFRKLEV